VETLVEEILHRNGLPALYHAVPKLCNMQHYRSAHVKRWPRAVFEFDKKRAQLCRFPMPMRIETSSGDGRFAPTLPESGRPALDALSVLDLKNTIFAVPITPHDTL